MLVLVGVLVSALVLVGVLELVGVFVGLLVGVLVDALVPVGVLELMEVLVGVMVGTQVPFWQICPTSSHERQTWSAPQTWQASPQSATVQQPPG